MATEKFFKIGYIAKTHGLKGEVTFIASPECPDLTEVPTFFIESKGNPVPYFIESISVRSDKAFIKLEDVDTPEAAHQLKGSSVFLEKNDRPRLPRGEFYNDEILGFQVTDQTLGALGTVQDVEEAGPNRFLIIQYLTKEVLIPVNGPFIKSVNKSKSAIIVDLPDGFLDI